MMEFLVKWGPLIIAILALIVSIAVPIYKHCAGKRERKGEKEEKLGERVAKLEGRIETFFAIHKLAEADKKFEKPVGDPSDYRKLGTAALSEGNYKKAIEDLDKATKLDPDNADTWFRKGLALDKFGRHELALKSYDKAIELNPDNAFAWEFKGLTLRILGRFKEADKPLEKAKELGYKE